MFSWCEWSEQLEREPEWQSWKVSNTAAMLLTSLRSCDAFGLSGCLWARRKMHAFTPRSRLEEEHNFQLLSWMQQIQTRSSAGAWTSSASCWDAGDNLAVLLTLEWRKALLVLVSQCHSILSELKIAVHLHPTAAVDLWLIEWGTASLKLTKAQPSNTCTWDRKCRASYPAIPGFQVPVAPDCLNTDPPPPFWTDKQDTGALVLVYE